MDLRIEPAGRYARIIALVALLQGLGDAAHLLGIAQGGTSPIHTLGVAGFTWLAVFAVARLFASVGLWLHAAWGAVLLVGATSVEIALYLLGGHAIQMSFFGFVLRLIVLIAAVFLMLFARALGRRTAHD